MEKIDVYDKFMQKTGKIIDRYTPLENGEFRRLVHSCIFNSKGEMLMQKRNPNKRAWPGFWDMSVGGGVQAGETINDAIHRETLEELGIDIDYSNARPFLTSHFSNGFDDFFVVKKDLKLNELNLKPDEVVDAKWASLDEIKSLQDKNEFVAFHFSFIELLFHYSKAGTIVDDTKSQK